MSLKMLGVRCVASLLEDIVTYLIVNNMVQGDGIDTFRDFIPESPEDIVALYEYAGDPINNFTDGQHRSVQVLVRSSDATAARIKALDIVKIFITDNLIVHFTEQRMGQVHVRQSPFKLSMDDKNRVTYAFNMGITTTIE